MASAPCISLTSELQQYYFLPLSQHRALSQGSYCSWYLISTSTSYLLSFCTFYAFSSLLISTFLEFLKFCFPEFYFLSMDVLSAYLSLYHVGCLVPTEAGSTLDPQGCSCTATLGTEHGSSKRALLMVVCLFPLDSNR